MSDRPVFYSKEIGQKVCALTIQGYRLKQICKLDDMPAVETVYTWLSTIAEFDTMYNDAKRNLAHVLAEEVLEIADDASGDKFTKKLENGGKGNFQPYHTPNPVAVSRAQLKINTRLKLMALLRPDLYGTKVDVTSAGAPIKGYAVLDPAQQIFSGDDGPEPVENDPGTERS